LGWEIACHLALLWYAGHFGKGWYLSTTIGVFGATAAAGKILKLDMEETVWALGMAACQSAGLRSSFGTMSREFQVGKVGLNSVMAVMMAQCGVNAPKEIFEGQNGFLQAYTEKQNPLTGLDNMGNPWKTLEYGIHLKSYPACSFAHPAIEATLALKKTHKVTPADIATVRVLIDPLSFHFLKFDRPQNAMEAKFSMPFCIALAMSDGEVTFRNFSDDRLRDPNLTSLMERITVECVPIMQPETSGLERGTKISLKFKDGGELSHEIRTPSGHPENPLKDTDVDAKFLECSAATLQQSDAREIIDIVRHLEDISRMGDVATLLSPQQKIIS
jgi:2-methylcitrate dehydratase PrpD